jgi:dTDP-4-amino-4,6-dideoxygalactose transaminase
MWIRKRLDISTGEILYALKSCLINGRKDSIIKSIKSIWEENSERAFICLSIRTGFDLLLQALKLKAGSEILMTELTIPDMPKIVRHHGLIPVPIRINSESLAPISEDLEAAITTKTKAIVVTHLFGAILDLEPIIKIAQENNLMIIEDCAQAFHGNDYHGHSKADISMFSFGTIKTATALGGGILIVRNNDKLIESMEEMYEDYPVQSRAKYMLKVLKYLVIKFLSRPIPFSIIVNILRILRVDYDNVMHNLSKSFPGDDFFRKIRYSPSLPLLKLLLYRFRNYSNSRIEKRIDRGNYLIKSLPDTCKVPGMKSLKHTYWVFPVLVPDPINQIEKLRNAGFDATQRQSMRIIIDESLKEEKYLSSETNVMLRQLIFLPLDPEMSNTDISRMADCLR